MVVSRFELPGDGVLAAQVCLAQRMPAGDPAEVRSVARRSGARSVELRRVTSTLLSCAETPLWSGAAHRAFVDQLRTQAPSLTATADRYEHYAGALNAYADALDQTAPQLLATRSRLWQRYDELVARTPAPAGCDARALPITPPAAELLPLARDFKSGYDRWADAVDSCVRALSRADEADPTRDLHGWSALRHQLAEAAGSALSPVERAMAHPSLHNISHCLGSLSTDLTVLGLGLLFLCPPAATACLTAATVLAAAQVTVDAARRARGEHLSAGQLGLEMAAAIPLGGRAVSGLRATGDVTRLVPGGGLMAHEGLEGGHTLVKHVGKTEDFLRNRLASEPHIDAASTFFNRELAEESLSAVLLDNEKKIATWLSTPRKELILAGRAAEPIGFMTFRESSTVHEASGIRLVLRQSSRLAIGYRIHTAMVTM